MRSCIYCGRELKDGEVCNCAGAVARRNAKEHTSQTSATSQSTQYDNQPNNNTAGTQSNSYRTGYTHQDSAFKNAWEKRKAKFRARKNAHHATKSANGPTSKGFWKNLWSLFVRFLVSPIDTISNPGYISSGTALMFSAISGGIINLCLYFLRSGAVRTPFGIVLSLLSLHPLTSYANLLNMVFSLLSGAVSGILIFFIYAGIFYLLNRLIFRQRVQFWDFSGRLALVPLPLVLTSIIGILFGMLSSTTLAILIVCGLIGTVIATYEALRTEWISYPPGKVLYTMLLGCFIFTTFICYIFRLSLIQ